MAETPKPNTKPAVRDSTHVKLDGLWRRRPDGKDFVIMLDRQSLYELQDDVRGWIDRSLGDSVTGPMTWRKTPIEVHHVSSLLHSSPSDAALVDLEEARLVAMRYICRKNGRVAYLDDAENDERFL